MMNIVVTPEDLKRYNSKSWEELPEPAREYIRMLEDNRFRHLETQRKNLMKRMKKNKESGAMKQKLIPHTIFGRNSKSVINYSIIMFLIKQLPNNRHFSMGTIPINILMNGSFLRVKHFRLCYEINFIQLYYILVTQSI